MKVNFIKFSQKSVYLTKRFCTKDKKIENFYDFMEDNMKKYNKSCPSNEANQKKSVNDVTKLIEVLKCPMTESQLEVCEEGLKVSHIIYPKRNGVYILKEDEAIFKFEE